MGNRNDLCYPREYAVWKQMRQRCDNPNHQSFERYGGRGITYDARWNLFENFLQDMGRQPQGLTLERVDNDLGYSKDNCVWTTWEEQCKNKHIRKDNSSGVAGVSFDRTYQLWFAHAKKFGRRRQLYRGPNFFEAVCARKSWDIVNQNR